jgi:hypothetical protein
MLIILRLCVLSKAVCFLLILLSFVVNPNTMYSKFKVCKSVHHHTIQINHQPDATISPVYYSGVYLQLNMFRASSRPSSGAQKLQCQPLVLPLECGGNSAVGRGRAGPTTTNSTATNTFQR